MVQKSSAAASAVPVRASTQDIWSGDVKSGLIDAVEHYDLPSKSEWRTLDELSSRTEFEGIQVFPDDAIFDAGIFVAPATVYVKLNYGGEPDALDFSEAFPASVVFDVKPQNGIEISKVDVDTSSFFDDEAAPG
jgi:hypothetical protein